MATGAPMPDISESVRKKQPHGDSRVTDGGNDGDEEPQEDGAEGERRTAILHHKERGDENEGGATVHVDGGADREHEAGDIFADAQAVLG